MIDLLGFGEPDGIPARGTLIVIPGRGEQPAVYRRFGARLASDAYRVFVVSDPTLDSQLTRQQVERALADDESTPAPVVLVGSDAGALFAAALAAERQLDGGGARGVDGLILAGLPSEESGAEAGSWEQELNDRTTCPTHRGRISDALVIPGALYRPLPSDWYGRAALDQIPQPILGLHGQEDPISAVELARAAYAAAPAAELVTIGGAPHDVLNDQTHRTVAATVVLWLERLRAAHGAGDTAADGAGNGTGSALAAIAHAEPIGANVA